MESSNITSTKYICALCQNSNNFKHCLVWKAQPGTIHSLFKQIQRCEREHGSQRDKRERDEGDWVRCRVWGLAGLRRVCVCVCVCVCVNAAEMTEAGTERFNRSRVLYRHMVQFGSKKEPLSRWALIHPFLALQKHLFSLLHNSVTFCLDCLSC